MSVYIVLVNYNGWRDTVECLESLFRCAYTDFRVLVCDNGSSDGSLEKIADWAEGKLGATTERGGEGGAQERPLLYARYRRDQAEAGGDPAEKASLVLIDCGGNLGFAGGNNVGLRYALARDDFRYAWLLNNDTVVEPDALGHLVQRLAEAPQGGLCGSTLIHYHDRATVQALGGGWYCKWLGLAWHLGRFSRWPRAVDREKVERQMSYPVGASIMITRRFLAEVGLMCEDYFLYFEELDWVLRAERRFALLYAPQSVVYHKVGATVGTSSNPARKSALCDYWNARNRLFFTRRWYPEAFPTVYLALCCTLLARVLLFRWDRVPQLVRLLVGRDR